MQLPGVRELFPEGIAESAQTPTAMQIWGGETLLLWGR